MEDSEKTRRVELSFSSEEPYRRWWGIEILGHDKGEVDMSWLETGHAPLLTDHNTRDQTGVIEDAVIGADRKGRAVVRFGKSARAEEIFQDVLDDIRGNVSVGYEISELRLVEEKDDVATYRVTSWRPLEISIVSIPADTTVGVGRSDERNVHDIPVIGIKENDMPPEIQTQTAPATTKANTIDTSAIRAQAEKSAREATSEIFATGKRFGMLDAAEKAANEGMPVDEFRKLVLAEQEKKLQRAGTPDTEIGLSEKEQKGYSLLRAMGAAAKQDWSKAGFEREASDAIADKIGREARGFFVPYDVLKRDLSTGTAAAGGDLVGTTHMAGSFIEMLRARMMVTNLGAKLLSGLVGDFEIPKQTGGASVYWIGEDDDTTGSDQQFGSVKLSPKTASAKTKFTRRLMLQSSPDVENLVRSDLATAIALGIDKAAISGAGINNEPTGILNISGIGAVIGGANGAVPGWADIVALETEVAADDADIGNLAYLTNAKVRGKLKTTEKAANTAQFIWGDGAGGDAGFGMLNGYRAGASNQVPSTLTKGTAASICSAILFGNWGDLLIGEWGVLDIQVDPYSAGDSGGTIVRAFQDVDVAARNAQSFAAMQDALTS
jgi:HK97 family phage major capsid protein